MTSAWPAGNEPAAFTRIVEPLARWFRLYQDGRVEPYDGLPLGEREAATALQPAEALTPASLAYNLADQGRDVVDVLLGIAVQLGIEQGRRVPPPIRLPMSHDLWGAFAHLRSESNRCDRSPRLATYATDLGIAAIAFTIQLAIEAGHDPAQMRALERALFDSAKDALAPL